MKHEAFIYDRGGVNLIGRLDGLVQVQWDRRRDDVSECSVIVHGMSADCCALLRDVRSVRHELVILRDGERVWEGPITHQRLFAGGAQISARDILFFAQRAVCTQKWSSAYDKVLRPNGEFTTARSERIIRAEMQRWEKAGARFIEGLDIRTTPDTAKTTRVSNGYAQYVWDDLDALAARSGMDYTVYGRSLIIFDTHNYIGFGPRITNADLFDDLEISEYGVELSVTSWVTDNNGSYGKWVAAESHEDYYGPVDLLHGAYDLGAQDTSTLAPIAPTKPKAPSATASQATKDQYAKDMVEYNKVLAVYAKELAKYLADLAEQAKRNGQNRNPTPALVRVPQNASLTPTAVESLWPWLIPGCAFPVYSDNTCWTMEQEQKLDRVTVLEDETGEKVSIIMSTAPAGSFYGEEGGATRTMTSAVDDGVVDGGYGYDPDDPDEVAAFGGITFYGEQDGGGSA